METTKKYRTITQNELVEITGGMEINVPIFKLLFPETATPEENQVQLIKILTYKIDIMKDEIVRLNDREKELQEVVKEGFDISEN